MLDLETIDAGLFRGRSTWKPSMRVFGGEVAAQSLIAAGRTVPAGRPVHSLHAYFLRPGSAALPVVYDVETIRDGGSYTTRRVTARQQGEATFSLSASFHAPENGFAHQVPQPTMPPPDDLPGTEEALADDQLVHSCAATYASDMLLLSVSLGPHDAMFGAADVAFASLDHAVWFHGPFRADDWLYYDQEGSWAGGGRAVCHGRMFDRAGRLVATVMQEGMVRRRRPPGAPS